MFKYECSFAHKSVYPALAFNSAVNVETVVSIAVIYAFKNFIPYAFYDDESFNNTLK